jgi:hypothetical protein
MSPKARAIGGETLDSPLRIDYGDDEQSKRKSFRHALKNPKALFRERKPGKKAAPLPQTPTPRSGSTIEKTRSFLAIASEPATVSVNHERLDQTSATDMYDEVLETTSADQSTLREAVDLTEKQMAGSQKRKPSRDHDDGMARSISKSKKETEEMLDNPQLAGPTDGNSDYMSATNPLQAWFEANRINPYPSTEEKEWLASQSGRTLQQISNWFHHKRSRVKSLERAENTQAAVREWMESLNGERSAQSALTSEDSLRVPTTPKV